MKAKGKVQSARWRLAVGGMRTAVSMKRLALSVLLLAALAVGSPPVVENVWFAQRTNSNLVDIWYDLSDPDGDENLTVSAQVSRDGGKSFTIVPRTVSGDIGPNQRGGKKKHIIWDAGRDYGSLKGKRFMVRVLADDGVVLRDTPDAVRPTPDGMRFLRKNEQGYEEYMWFKDSSVMVKVPAGEFTMGSSNGDDDEKPVHQIYLDEYYIDKYEVTNRQYKRFCDATGRSYPEDPDFLGMADYIRTRLGYPVVNVSWNDAKAYCEWAGKRLPTEAEWEKAARGTDAREYPWGNGLPSAGGFYRSNYDCYDGKDGSDHSIYKRDGYEYTAPVGSFPRGASPSGCADMAGNVWEWCNDWYDSEYYGSSASNNPTGPSLGSARIIRGGSWNDYAGNLRCANRLYYEPSYRYYYLGFRCSRRQ